MRHKTTKNTHVFRVLLLEKTIFDSRIFMERDKKDYYTIKLHFFLNEFYA